MTVTIEVFAAASKVVDAIADVFVVTTRVVVCHATGEVVAAADKVLTVMA